ncbi:MAG: IclR family transcriptional regulator [Acidimicrobiaceae bacterium]|jgi:DNA-binding IclR family transcriptional regulator|nr:IclR family transcriptional regulator [Acidimicrobiaceae bacterium]
MGAERTDSPRTSEGSTDPPASTASRSVERALAMLELIGRTGRPLGLSEIATSLSVPKSSALRLLRGLVKREFARLQADGRYALGVRSFEIGAAYLRAMTPVSAVVEELEALTADLGMTAHFAVLDGSEVLYLAKHDPPDDGLRLATSLGARLPACSTAVGKAVLAYRSQATHGTGADRPAPPTGPPTSSETSLDLADALFVELAKVRAHGYAIDEGSTAAGIRCVASPVFDSSGCCGALGVSSLQHGGQHSGPTHDEVVATVLAAARRSTARLGGAFPGSGLTVPARR